MHSTVAMIGAALLLAPALTGCAQVVGIEEFSVGEGASPGSDGGGSEAPVDVCNAVHGCTRTPESTADGIGSLGVEIRFTTTGFGPRCTLIDSGTRVTFKSHTATFVQVPISGGIFPDADPTSPIKTPQDATSTEATFVLSGACVFPYFSAVSGQTGAIFVK